ncbi:uncharacterized protein [Elaeis guineensis]|uniref:Uncharacterized protein LOC105042492 n=1 Tax=Elaeis guineensis var. tenera TaxID=51953 RepID=A0A6I9QZN3_ELAGV|nr:uncharacterized protein LOC105042492 [Elaeis guineensis]
MPAVARGVPRRAFIGRYTALLKSNVKGRWKSFAASVPSGSYKPQKGQRKSKEERRTMIEAFVDTYKASNAGKFPTASHIRQEIGGSYYVIREIIQELEYSHKLSLSNKVEVVQLEKAEKVIDPSSVAKEHFLSNEKKILTSRTTAKTKSNKKSTNQIMVDECPSLKDDEANMHLVANEDKAIEKPSIEEPVSPVVMVVDPSQERLQDSAQVSKRDRNSSASTSSISSEQQVEKSSVSLKSETEINISQSASGQIEGNRTDISTTKFSRDMDNLKGVGQMGNHEAPKTEELHREQPRSSEHGEKSPKTASFWENLKSLTDGIINFWKKM